VSLADSDVGAADLMFHTNIRIYPPEIQLESSVLKKSRSNVETGLVIGYAGTIGLTNALATRQLSDLAFLPKVRGREYSRYFVAVACSALPCATHRYGTFVCH